MNRFEKRYQQFVVEAGADLLRPDDRLSRLLGLEDLEFVKLMFRIYLGRNPTASDLTHFLAHLSKGHSRLDILCDIRFSIEGRDRHRIDDNFEKALEFAHYLKQAHLPRFIRAICLKPWLYKLKNEFRSRHQRAQLINLFG